MSELTRPLAATVSLLCLWFIAMILEAMRAPVWALGTICGVLLANVILLAACILEVTREQDGGDGDGDVPLHRPDRPEPGNGGGPSWWAEVERYLAEQERQKRRPQRDPVGV
jgi:hypothetical protein